MLDELVELLKHAEEYEGCWHDGELYVRPIVHQPTNAKEGELEPELT